MQRWGRRLDLDAPSHDVADDRVEPNMSSDKSMLTTLSLAGDYGQPVGARRLPATSDQSGGRPGLAAEPSDALKR
jgi:hypothetical protein